MSITLGPEGPLALLLLLLLPQAPIATTALTSKQLSVALPRKLMILLLCVQAPNCFANTEPIPGLRSSQVSSLHRLPELQLAAHCPVSAVATQGRVAIAVEAVCT